MWFSSTQRRYGRRRARCILISASFIRRPVAKSASSIVPGRSEPFSATWSAGRSSTPASDASTMKPSFATA